MVFRFPKSTPPSPLSAPTRVLARRLSSSPSFTLTNYVNLVPTLLLFFLISLREASRQEVCSFPAAGGCSLSLPQCQRVSHPESSLFRSPTWSSLFYNDWIAGIRMAPLSPCPTRTFLPSGQPLESPALLAPTPLISFTFESPPFALAHCLPQEFSPGPERWPV